MGKKRKLKRRLRETELRLEHAYGQVETLRERYEPDKGPFVATYAAHDTMGPHDHAKRKSLLDRLRGIIK